MRVSLKQLNELYKLLELFENDETVIKIDDEGKIKSSIKQIKEIIDAIL